MLAYLDPGSGSIVFQAVVGAVLAGGYVARSAIARLFRGMSRKSAKSSEVISADIDE